jgi:hypothetical protein
MAKRHRMALVTALALWCGLAPAGWWPAAAGGLGPVALVLAAIAALSLLTAARRLARAARALRGRGA